MDILSLVLSDIVLVLLAGVVVWFCLKAHFKEKARQTRIDEVLDYWESLTPEQRRQCTWGDLVAKKWEKME